MSFTLTTKDGPLEIKPGMIDLVSTDEKKGRTITLVNYRDENGKMHYRVPVKESPSEIKKGLESIHDFIAQFEVLVWDY